MGEKAVDNVIKTRPSTEVYATAYARKAEEKAMVEGLALATIA